MKDQILELVHQAHALTESTAVAEIDLLERKKLVLADLSLHLVQAALRHEQPNPAELKRYLFSVLTVADVFVDDLDLKAMADALLAPVPAAEPTDM
ncbi:hypothetical protein [Solirubrum puertoriconensis]|uniref:Uncharacterized protein n=1 Tax=Solirubrum puertoriconensis TaxID=1751427 RepID=A0A9X0HHA5_SOLP1|nr:hypothetical protein [Solirubrum puertoriconensis]KUG05848.1 hypothetical protein ASU33_00210 [Solirubrum puertoriconensis]